MRYKSVFDSQRSEYHFYRVTRRDDGSIMVFDYTRANYCGGHLPNLYDFETSSYLNVQKRTPDLLCYDYESGSHLRGLFNGGVVTIYDYEGGATYKYKIV